MSESLIEEVAEPTGEPANSPDPSANGVDKTAAEHAWFWAEGQQGEGEPPEWLKVGKYKSVADQAKAYTEAEKRLGAFTGAPEEYELSLPEDMELPEGVDVALDKDDPLMVEAVKWGKAHNLSQDGFTQLVGMYVRQQVNDYSATQVSMAKEKESLGADADARINSLARWGKANMDEELYDMFTRSMAPGRATPSEVFKVFEHLVSKTRSAPLPDPSNLNPNLMATKVQELKELEGKKGPNGELLWLTDPAHRAKIESLRKQVVPPGEHRQVVG